MPGFGMQTRCARFPAAGPVFDTRCSVLGVGPAQVLGTRDAVGQSGNKAVGQ
jgi:hypothetical protein